MTKPDWNDVQVDGDHYRRKKFIQQHWDYAWDHEYDQFQYCITKYVDRHKYKNGLIDLYKAKHHLEKYISLLEGEAETKREWPEFGDAADRAMHYADAKSYVNPDLDQTVKGS